MFRALEHDGVATECLVELFVGGRRLKSEERVRVITACAVIAKSLHAMREPPVQNVRLAK